MTIVRSVWRKLTSTNLINSLKNTKSKQFQQVFQRIHENSSSSRFNFRLFTMKSFIFQSLKWNAENETGINFNVVNLKIFLFSSFILVLAIRNGKEIARFTGLIDEDRIETILDQLNRWHCQSFLFEIKIVRSLFHFESLRTDSNRNNWHKNFLSKVKLEVVEVEREWEQALMNEKKSCKNDDDDWQ